MIPRGTTPSDAVRQLTSLTEIATLVNASSDLGTMLDRIVLAICRYTQWDMSSIMSIDEELGRTILMARFDPQFMEAAMAPRTWDLQTSPAVHVLRTGKPIVLLDAKNDPTYPFYRADARERDYSTVVILPLPARDMYGRQMVIAVQSKAPAAVDEEASEFLLTVSHLAAIAVEKTRRLADEQALSEHMRQTVEIAGVLMQLVLSDASPGRVLEVVERLLGRSVCVTDLSAAAVLVSEDTQTDEANGDVLGSVRQRLDAALRAPASTPIQEAACAQTQFLSGRIYALEVDGERVGDLYLLGEHSEIDTLDKLLVQQVQFAISVLLMRSVVRFKSLAQSQSQIVEELTRGQWRKEEDIRSRAASVGIRLSAAARLAVVGLQGPTSGNTELLEQNHRAVGFLVAQAFEGSTVVMIRATEWVLWLPASDPDSTNEAGDDALLNVLCVEIGRLVGRESFLCISERCERVQDYAPAWAACVRVAQLAMRFARSGVLRERDFGADALILAAIPPGEAHSFQNDTLERLAAFDERNGSQLLCTVDTFLRCNCKLQRCADTLSIHVTTLRYRLDRLRDMFGVDFDDADQRFSLQLALRIRTLTESSSRVIHDRAATR